MSSSLSIELSKHSLHTWFSFLNDQKYFTSTRLYDALEYSVPISNQVKMIVNSSPLREGKYDYSRDRKKVYAIFICITKILLPWTFG